MTGLRVTLSNGMVSPIFKTQADHQSGPIEIGIGKFGRVFGAGIRSDNDGVYGVRFIGDSGEEVGVWEGDVN